VEKGYKKAEEFDRRLIMTLFMAPKRFFFFSDSPPFSGKG